LVDSSIAAWHPASAAALVATILELLLSPPGVSSISLQRLASVAGLFILAVAWQECPFHQATLLDSVRSGVSSRIYGATSASNALAVAVNIHAQDAAGAAQEFFPAAVRVVKSTKLPGDHAAVVIGDAERAAILATA
jgi:hypothetical protein